MSLEPIDPMLTLTVPELLRRRAAEYPTHVALSARSACGWRDRLTYAQLVDRMECMAAEFAALGLEPGDRVALLLGNEAGRECFLSSLGALRLGAVVSPLNTRQAADDLAYCLELIGPRFVITDARGAERVAAANPDLAILMVGPDVPTGRRAWPDPDRSTRPQTSTVAEPTDPDTLGVILFTSGTTARSKGVMHSHRTMIGTGLCCSRALGLRAGDLYQGGWPFFTSSGLNLGGMSSWVAGAGLVFEEPLDNAGRLRLIAREQSTFYHGVPSVIHFIIDEYDPRDHDVRSLQRVGYGGSAMPTEVVLRIAERWPHVEQVEIFGMTESGPTGTVLPPTERLKRFGTVGGAMPFCEVKVIGPDGQAVPNGETGEIHVAGPAVAMGYWRNPEATAEAFAHGGICTGDMGHFDADGFLHYTDRRKDVINRGGLKIASVSVEDVLYRHPDIKEAAVIAIPHPALGEDVGACLVPKPGHVIDIEDVARFCVDHLADYARPRTWRVLAELPRNPMGKVLKRELRDLFGQA